HVSYYLLVSSYLHLFFPVYVTSLLLFLFFFQSFADYRDLHSFPTRRSSDLDPQHLLCLCHGRDANAAVFRQCCAAYAARPCPRRDRKSTRLNSSHVSISYAVFCLKKKKQE